MKTTLKILLFVVALAGITACSPQKRAARHLRRAVALCPELVQTKAHPIDTVLTVPGYADCATLKLADVYSHDTLYAATEHGTVVVSLRQSDSALRVGFVAAPQNIHYKDTIQYAEVTAPSPNQEQQKGNAWRWIVGLLLGVIIGFAGLIAIALKVTDF